MSGGSGRGVRSVSERINLDDSDPLLSEANAYRCLADGEPRQLLRTDEVRLASAQQPANQRSGWP